MATGLTVVKKFTYRGNSAEEWSNTYWFSGTTPANAAAWDALATLLGTEEKKLYTSRTSIVAYYGYSDDSDDRVAVWSKDLHATPVAGTLQENSGIAASGDTAVWIRWQTGRFTEKGKKIYLRKYFHDVYSDGATGRDIQYPIHKAVFVTFGTKLQDGSFDGTRHMVGRGHVDDVLSSSAVSPYLTTRTLKRRGKRPGSSAP